MKLKPYLTISLAILAGAACTAAPASAPVPAALQLPATSPTPPAVPATGVATITPTDLFARIGFLASDALRGRDTPSEGLEVAAAYLVSEYRRLGLLPAGENGTYYQRYPYPLVALDTGSAHLGTVIGGKDNQMLAYGTDYFSTSVQSGGGTEMGDARPLYVGVLGESGLPAGDYHDAAPLVVVPGAYTRDWRISVSRALNAARAAGARALLVAVSSDFPAKQFTELAHNSRAASRRVPDTGEIPVFYLTRAAAERVVARAGQSLDRLPASPSAPVALGQVEAHFAADAAVLDPRRAPNIVAVLPGSDPQLRDEYVVLSAHMDHVGVGRPVNGDSIYNGADDDASGTSGILEVAEAFASLPERPRRSIIFLHVSGEEKGLLGSHWFSEHPTVPLEKIVANVNVDMIGRNDPDTVVVIGKNYSSLGGTANQVQAAHPELHLTLSDDIWPEERFFFRSDHYNFARKEIPAIFFFSGVHEDYHKPSDEVEKIDTDKAARIARMIFYTVQDIANTPARPKWDPRGLAEVRSMTR
jgi:hypothetical protein